VGECFQAIRVSRDLGGSAGVLSTGMKGELRLVFGPPMSVAGQILYAAPVGVRGGMDLATPDRWSALRAGGDPVAPVERAPRVPRV
jgi:hypothetical protein